MTDFEWVSRLRYYWREDVMVDMVQVRAAAAYLRRQRRSPPQMRLLRGTCQRVVPRPQPASLLR